MYILWTSAADGVELGSVFDVYRAFADMARSAPGEDEVRPPVRLRNLSPHGLVLTSCSTGGRLFDLSRSTTEPSTAFPVFGQIHPAPLVWAGLRWTAEQDQYDPGGPPDFYRRPGSRKPVALPRLRRNEALSLDSPSLKVRMCAPFNFGPAAAAGAGPTDGTTGQYLAPFGLDRADRLHVCGRHHTIATGRDAAPSRWGVTWSDANGIQHFYSRARRRIYLLLEQGELRMTSIGIVIEQPTGDVLLARYPG